MISRRMFLRNGGLALAGPGRSVSVRQTPPPPAGVRPSFDATGDTLNVKAFGAIGDGRSHLLSERYGTLTAAQRDYPFARATNQQIDWAAAQAAINAAAGRVVLIPPGTYVIDAPLEYVTTKAAVFSPGLNLVGAGSGTTILDHRVANAALIAVDTNADGAHAYFQRSIRIEGLTISGASAPQPGADGISLRHAYLAALDDLHVTNLTGTGLVVRCQHGDSDSSGYISLRRSRINACAAWGVHVDTPASPPSVGEAFLIAFDHVWITQCGRSAVASPPASGGMRWKGQMLTMRDSSFSENRNVGFYNYGGAGLALCLLAESCTWENTIADPRASRSAQVLLEGVDNARLVNCQLKSTTALTTAYGLLVDSTHSVRGLVIEGTNVRAPKDGAYTAFDVVGPSNCQYARVAGTIWSQLDAATQTRFGPGLLGHVGRVAITDEGVTFPVPESQLVTNVNATSDPYTPDLTRCKIHKIKANPGARTVNVGQPNVGANANGKEMVIHIHNASGGAITVNFNQTIVVRGFMPPADTGHTAARFYFDSSVGWVQVGGWS